MNYYAGLDFGTSGTRIIVIDEDLNPVYERATVYDSEGDRRNPQTWLQALWDQLGSLPPNIKTNLIKIAMDGTSSTVLICNEDGDPIAPPKMYNDPCNEETRQRVKDLAPPNHIVQSATSSFAKLLDWQNTGILPKASYLVHQTDWLSAQLHGDLGKSDFHNSLKLGFNPETLTYPEFFQPILNSFIGLLPSPTRPGKEVGPILSSVASSLDLSPNIIICAGTTDSIAAFLASEATQTGDAVTSLGSTIALKLLSQHRVDEPKFGVYSHWFGQNWLVGGASNAGGAVLAQFFSPAEIEQLSSSINWSRPPQYQYVPLLKKGERFPNNDPELEPFFFSSTHKPSRVYERTSSQSDPGRSSRL